MKGREGYKDSMKTLIVAGLAALAVLGCANAALAQADPLTDPLPRALGQQADRRLDRVEQTLREMRAILFQGRDTGRPVVVQPAETQAQVDQLVNRVGDLEETLRRLNGQIDTLGADVAALRAEAARRTADAQTAADANRQILARLEVLERQAAITAADAQVLATDPAKAFDNAMQLFVDGQHRAAGQALQTYLEAHPDGADAPEARYYLGESFFKQGIYNDAASAYVAAIRGWPQTTWAPDAVVKLALSLIETRRNPDACAVLGEFSTRYPRASATLKTQAASARTRARCS